jgi:hypothetical protein
MFKNRSKVLLVANILGELYAIYLLAHFVGAVGSTEGAEQVGAGLATAQIMPHFVMILLAVIFGLLGFFLRKMVLILLNYQTIKRFPCISFY